MNKKYQVLGFLSVFFIAINLRAPIVAVGTMAKVISADQGLSGGLMGLLTTLPLVTFSIASFLSAPILKRVMLLKAIIGGILLIMLGELIRTFATTIGLYFGTIIMGIGIGFENVWMLTFIKKYFSTKIGLMTGFFSSMMSLSSGIGSWVSVQLVSNYQWSWRAALSIWIPAVLVALIIWIIQAKFVLSPLFGKEKPSFKQRNNLLNQKNLIIYIGLQSFLFYSVIAWMPSIVQNIGVTDNQVGLMTFLLQIVTIPAGFFFPILAQRMEKPQKLILVAGSFLVIGVAFLLFGLPISLNYVSVLLIAIGLGGSFSMGMALINFYTASSDESSALSGKALMFGYLFASIGPLLIGYLFEKTLSWDIPIYILIFVDLIMVYFGLHVNTISDRLKLNN